MYLLHHFLEESARRHPHKIALVCGDERLSYVEVDTMADRVSQALLDMGVQRGDRVAIYMDNSTETVIAMFGTLKAGGIFVMLNPGLKSRKLGYILQHSGAKVLLASQTGARIVNDILDAGLNELGHIIWKGRIPLVGNKGVCQLLWDELLEKRPGAPVSGSAGLVDMNPCIDLDLATIIYTSGSTADPKGVMCAHYSMIAAARSITSYLHISEEDIILCCLPLSFDYGLYQVLMAFLAGATVILEKSFAYPYPVMERVAQEGVTGFPLVPTMAAILIQMERISELDFSRLRYITNAAAALPASHIKRLQSLFPGVEIFSMYGLTECKRVSYLPPEYIDKYPDSVGIPIPNEEVWIVDEQGRRLPPGEVGELVVRGSNVMQGYWRDPDETALRFKEVPGQRGYILYTGDLFRQDSNGLLYFISRKDDLIKSRAERISPKEIEACLHDLEGVAEAAVIGVPDEVLGQAIKAFVVLQQGSSHTAESILKHCRRHLEPFKVPSQVELMDSLPKLPSGKVDKRRLADS